MFVLKIFRTSSKICHVLSKTRSPGQILINSCLQSRGHINNPISMKLDQNVCLSNVQNKFEFWKNKQLTRSNLRKFLFTLQGQQLQTDFDETSSECLFGQYLTQLLIWVMSGQKLGHEVKSKVILVYTLKATFATRFYETQNVCFENIQVKFENMSCLVKNKVSRSNLRKILFTLQRPHLRPDFDETGPNSLS